MTGLDDYRDEPQFRSALRSIRSLCNSDRVLAEGSGRREESGLVRIGKYEVTAPATNRGSLIYRAANAAEKPVWIKRIPKGAVRDAQSGSFMSSYAALRHPNLARVIDVIEREGVDYLVFDLAEAMSLNQLLDIHGPIQPSVACEMTRQVSLGLSFLHDQSLTHGQVNPQNIVLTSKGTIKLLEPAPSSTDRRRDIHGMGITLFRLVTGSVPQVGLNGSCNRPTAAVPQVASVLDLAIQMCSSNSDGLRSVDEFGRQLTSYCDSANWRNFIRLLELQSLNRDDIVSVRQANTRDS